MSDTKRCPMCGNANPVDAEVCPHCHAQLKPIIGGANPPESSTPPSEGRDEMDWLRNLAGADESPLVKNGSASEDNEPVPEDDSFLLDRINLSSTPPAKEESSKQTPAFSLADDEEEGNADWLRVLEESSARKENAAHSLPEADNSDLDAWLENLGASSTPPPAAPQPEPPAALNPTRKLTERLKEEGLAKEEPKQGDWMNTLCEKSSDETAPKASEPTDPASVFTSSSVDRTGSLLGWLDDETPFSENLDTANDAGIPDWLNEESPEEESSSPILPDLPLTEEQPAQAADLPDWLRDMAPATSSPTEPPASADHDDLPSWLQDETEDAAADLLDFQTGTGDDMSDLLSGFHTEEMPAEQTPSAPAHDIFALNAKEEPVSPFPFGGELPIEKDDSFEEDILIGVPSSARDEVPAEESSINIPTGDGEDLLDWLKEDSPADVSAPFAASPFTEEPESGSTAPFEGDSDLPNWLADETPALEAAPFDSSLPFGDDADLPDWLTSGPPSTEDDGTQEEPPAVKPPAFSSSPFLDNLASKDGISYGDDLSFEDKAPKEDTSPFGDISPFEDAAPFGDGAPFGDVTPFNKENLFADDTPLARDEYDAGASESAPAGDEHPFAEDSLPDWLESEEASQIMPEQTGTGDAAENLSPAQLPGWLAAMRPVESVAIDNGGNLNEHIEKSGPLAGLRGVLPVDVQAIKYRKPPVYSVKLRVTETQAAHAGLMEDLLERENKPSEAKRVGAQGSKRLMQLVVALVLTVVLILFRGAGTLPDIPVRPYLSPFVTSFFKATEALPSGSAVLLAVDYEPGYSGELKAASNAAIQRLMSKQQRIAVISTVPAGPALAEDLLQQAYLDQQASVADYINTHTINLGYLPGGITSLKEFALRPKQAAHYGLTTQYDGLIPWDHPALEGVNALTDFSAVIVITDSVESGRAWVEQVQPSLGSTPMLLISSAQSAPMLEPYVQSGQLSGMLSGLGGSVAYENLIQQPGTGHTYWIALQGGLAVVVALILVGILLELFVTLVASRRTQSEA